MIELTIPGKPIAKKRPRFSTKGKFPRAYNPQETEEGKFIAQVLHQLGGHKPITGPVRIKLLFMLPRPKNHYGTGRNVGKLKASAPKFPLVKPDVDNCVKFIYDCFNGIIWEDDKQVVDSQETKIYSESPGTVIQVEAV